MPTLNSEEFLVDRLDSIRKQTYTNWELVVVDSQSTDATLQMIESFAREGFNVRISQGPRDGIYTNINRAIEYSKGEFIYIATSDDTMAHDCLEKMVSALEYYPQCGLAHCGLQMFDASNKLIQDNWWSSRSTFYYSSEDLIYATHVRKAPYDGLLHMLGKTVYISLTQLLIRRSMFDRIGLFRSDWGSISDFYWEMRASLITDTVHVGDTWAGWRIHDSQATAAASIGNDCHRQRIDGMIEHALHDAQSDLSVQVRSVLGKWTEESVDLRIFLDRLKKSGPRLSRSGFVLVQLLKGSSAAWRYVYGKFNSNFALPERSPHVLEALMIRSGLRTIERVKIKDIED